MKLRLLYLSTIGNGGEEPPRFQKSKTSRQFLKMEETSPGEFTIKTHLEFNAKLLSWGPAKQRS